VRLINWMTILKQLLGESHGRCSYDADQNLLVQLPALVGSCGLAEQLSALEAGL
jgi:hypothetical protein